MTNETKRGWLSGDIVPLLGAIALTVVAIIFRGPLLAWFTGETIHSSAPVQVPSASSGNLTLSTALDPDPPREKGNVLVLGLADKAGAPIDGAEISVAITMPAMGAMAAMKTAATVTPRGSGAYRAAFDLAMGGTWTVRIVAATAKESIDAEYTLTVGNRGLVLVNASGSAAGGSPGSSYAFGDLAKKEISRAFAAYEVVREKLAADDESALAKPSTEIADALRALRTNEPKMPGPLDGAVAAGATAAELLARAVDLVEARAAFKQLSEHLANLAAADPTAVGELHMFECPMTEGYNKWLQPSARLANPYQGSAMMTCGSEIEIPRMSEGAQPQHVHDPTEIDHYTCPMDTWVKTKTPGNCPVCGMTLVPVTTEEMKTGVMRIDHRRRQLIGLRTGLAELRPMTMNIRAIGKIDYDQRLVSDITLKYDGFIERLLVNEPGQKVSKGQTLFTVYSPELYTAQQEYLLALQQRDTAINEQVRARAQALVDGAKARLHLMDISSAQLKKIADRGEPLRYVPIASPAGGYLVEKNVVEGAALKAGQRLFRVAGLNKIWVEAEVYEQDIPFVKVGQRATVTLSHLPGRSFEGTISFIYPYLDGAARTARARIELVNKDLELKPDMYATVEFSVELGERLAIPEAAVIYSGPRRIVFLDIGGDRLRPQQIEVGVKAGGYFEILSGVKRGDIVITSGNFLLSAETRLKSATGLW